MIGYVYFIEGENNLLKIGYTQHPRSRVESHFASKRLSKTMGRMLFVGCVRGTRVDERYALSCFHKVKGVPFQEIRLGRANIGDVFPRRKIFSLDDPSLPRCPLTVGIPRETHKALVRVSKRTGVKIRVLVDQALRKSYPISRAVKENA